MRPTIGRCSNRTTSKTSLLTLNEQRNLRYKYQMLCTRHLFKLFFAFCKNFLKELRYQTYNYLVTNTVRTKMELRQGQPTLLRKKFPNFLANAAAVLFFRLGYKPNR